MSGYRYESFAEKNLDIVNRSGAEYMVRCLFHDEASASMQFNVEKGLYICFGCDAKGTVRTLEKELGLRVVENEVDVSDIKKKLDLLKGDSRSEDLPVLPETYLDRYRFPTRYWAGRGFSKPTVEAFDLGADPMGDYVTIPIRNVKGELLGVIRRFIGPDVELRYKYPKGFKRSLNMFGSWMVEQDEDAYTVALNEGSLDAIKVWEAGFPAMAVYGSSLSKTQIRILRRLGVQKVVLFFDNDKAGLKAIESCLGVKRHKRSGKHGVYETTEYDPEMDLSREFIVKIAQYQDGGPTDPGDMTAEEITEAIESARDPDMQRVAKSLSRPRKWR